MMAYLSFQGHTAARPSIPHGKLLKRHRFVNKLRDTLSNIGIFQGSYSGHSFRVKLVLLLQLPNMASQMPLFNSLVDGRAPPSYLVYIKTSRDRLASITATLSASS